MHPLGPELDNFEDAEEISDAEIEDELDALTEDEDF